MERLGREHEERLQALGEQEETQAGHRIEEELRREHRGRPERPPAWRRGERARRARSRASPAVS
jgi:hypothetical protein